MRLRTKYILFVSILHLVTLVLSYFIFRGNQILFIASEFLILISIIISVGLYKQLLQPLQTLMRGVEAIKDRDFNVKFVKTGKYEMDQLIAVYNSMVDQLRDERTKQEQQHFFLEKLIHTSPTGIIILDHDDKIQQLNPQAMYLLNMEEKQLIGKSIDDVSAPMMQEIRNLRSGEAKLVTLDGLNTFKLQKSHFIDRGFPRSFVMMEELTAEILAAEKKAYGKVIRMMAHEVNNTIGPVNSIVESALSREELWQHQQNKSLREALEVALHRNRNLNVFMRNFADVVRLPEPMKKKIDLHQLIRNVTKLTELKAEESNIQIQFDLSSEPIYISGDEQQLEQALINILKNAAEAIGTNGKISIRTTSSPKRLIIADTGKGISADDAQNIFTPFFSTKKDGQGIGLTLIKEILYSHGFQFSLKTITPCNTEFEIAFA